MVIADRDPGDETYDPIQAGVIAHRMRRLSSLGFAGARALELAETNVDVREIARLVDKGCPLELAAEIVR